MLGGTVFTGNVQLRPPRVVGTAAFSRIGLKSGLALFEKRVDPFFVVAE